MIYDKNQFSFNLIFVFILLASISLNVYYAKNFKTMQDTYMELNKTLAKVESNQNFNFIQGSHNTLDYFLTAQGFIVTTADDYGTFSGPSMQPSIFDSNILIEKKYHNETLQEGSIIRFMRGNEAVIHRVRADYGSTVFVQGDSLKEGEIISKDKITHIVIGVLYT